MNTQTQTNTELNVTQLLVNFANKRPGLNPRDYISDWQDVEGRLIYMRESREITKDLHDFTELYRACNFMIPDLEKRIKSYLLNSSDRLTLTESGKLQYITGQYFPTEYRPAAARVLSSILWRYVCEAYNLQTGGEIREKLKKIVSRRVMKNYFN